jgi:hypothetical protein
MLEVDTGASEFDDFRAPRLKGVKFKFLRAVIAEFRRRVHAGLQTIRPDNLARRTMLDDEVVAHGVERVFVEAAGVGLGEAFVELKVETKL